MNLLGGGRGGTMPMFSAATLFYVYTSLTAFVTLVQQFYFQFVPTVIHQYISKTLEQWFTNPRPSSSLFTLVIEQYEDGDYEFPNQIYTACEAYLANKLKSTSNRLKVNRAGKKDHVSFKLAQGEKYCEEFGGVQLKWSFVCDDVPDLCNVGGNSSNSRLGNKYFELSIDPLQKDFIFNTYLSHILEHYDEMITRKKELYLYNFEGGLHNSWRSVTFKHPFTFDALAMDPEMKRVVMDDLDRFLNRKEFYKKVGKAWKRGYLLYGPPGTGKSSLIAAIANYLKFDIYDLQLSSVVNDSVLRRLLLSTTNRSILVIEDIDCSLGLAVRQRHFEGEGKDPHGMDYDQGSQISMSALLNFIDGLWSSCGDERIVILTTNYKDRLDPALLRPGRMDMHIHMSYLTMPAFKILASNYLNISNEHPLFGKIEPLIQATNVTPAQVAEELIRSDDADMALSRVVDMLLASRPNNGVTFENGFH